MTDTAGGLCPWICGQSVHITSLLAKMGLQRRTQVAAWVASRKHSSWRAEPGH